MKKTSMKQLVLVLVFLLLFAFIPHLSVVAEESYDLFYDTATEYANANAEYTYVCVDDFNKDSIQDFACCCC